MISINQMSFIHLIYKEGQMKWYVKEDNFKFTRRVMSSGRSWNKIIYLYL